jgi:hypothetical protein
MALSGAALHESVHVCGMEGGLRSRRWREDDGVDAGDLEPHTDKSASTVSSKRQSSHICCAASTSCDVRPRAVCHGLSCVHPVRVRRWEPVAGRGRRMGGREVS